MHINHSASPQAKSVFTSVPEPIQFAIGRKGLNQLREAEQKQAGVCLVDLPVFKRWFVPFADRPTTYLAIDSTKYSQGRSHDFLASLIAVDFEEEATAQAQYFTNPMEYPTRNRAFGTGPNGAYWGPRPAERIANGGICFITAEVDIRLGTEQDRLAAASLLGGQLAAMRCTKRPEDSLLGLFDKMLRRFKDYRGCVAVWSGNKSIHFHFAFATDHLSGDLAKTRHGAARWRGDATPDELRELYKANSKWLLSELQAHLGLDVGFDQALTSWVCYRRMPGGTRWAGDGNLLGIPAGTPVPQLVLFDLSKEKAPNGATDFLFDHSRIPASEPKVMGRADHSDASNSAKETAGVRQAQLDGNFDENREEILLRLVDLCWTQWGQEYPKPVDLTIEQGEVVVHFANSEHDRQPSSVMRGSWEGLHLAGQHEVKGGFRLYRTLGKYLAEFEEQIAALPPTIDIDTLSAIERKFHQAKDPEEARALLGEILDDVIVGPDRLVLVQAPEGMGKTTHLVTSLPARRRPDPGTLASLKANRERSGWMLISVPSYCQGDDKKRAFEAANPDMRAVIIRSVSNLYEEAAATMGFDPIDIEDAALNGATGWFDAVLTEQPEVIERMREMVAEVWAGAEFDPARTVLISVHDVTEDWLTASPTRTFWHPDWTVGASPEQVERLQHEMRVGDIVFDEIDRKNLEDLLPYDRVALFRHCVSKIGKSYRDATLAERYTGYTEGMADIRVLTESQRKAAASFRFKDFIEVGEIEPKEGDLVVVSTAGHEFGRNSSDKDIYKARNGDRYFIKPKTWMFRNRARIIFLTTEGFPAEMARGLHHKGEGIVVHDLTRALGIPRCTVHVHLDKRVSKDQEDEDRLTGLIEEQRQILPTSWVISNNVKGLHRSMSHTAARGSNDHTDSDILAFYSMIPPHQYAELLASGQAHGIADPIRSYYLDVFNQTTGRNRGYRDAGAQHLAFMHPAVHRYLKDRGAFQSNRYSIKKMPVPKVEQELQMAA